MMPLHSMVVSVWLMSSWSIDSQNWGLVPQASPAFPQSRPPRPPIPHCPHFPVLPQSRPPRPPHNDAKLVVIPQVPTPTRPKAKALTEAMLLADLDQYFRKYGEVVEAVIMRDLAKSEIRLMYLSSLLPSAKEKRR
ncbi:hypothetical protein ACFX2B_009176 [Malus domestica]